MKEWIASRPNLIALALLSLWFAGLYSWSFDAKIDLNGDNVAYIALGKSLAQGSGYRIISEPNAPLDNHFPPGYPFLLSLLMRISDSLTFLKVANGLLFLLALFLFYLLLRQLQWPFLLSLGTAMLLGANSHLLRYSTIVMSEIPFLTCSIALFYLFSLSPQELSWKTPRFGAILLLVVAAIYLRTAGIALLFGVLFHLILSKQWKSGGILLLGSLLLLLPWQLRSAGVPGDSYSSQLLMVNPYREELGTVGIPELWNRFIANLTRYIHAEIPSGMLPFFDVSYKGEFSEWMIGLLLIALVLWGLWKLPRGRSLVGGVLSGSFGILLLWPEVWNGVRFLLGVLPLLVMLAIWGLFDLIRRISPHAVAIPMVMALLLLFTLKPLHAMAQKDYPPVWKNYIRIAEWVKENVPSSVVVIARKPTLFWYWSGHASTNYRMTLDAEALVAHIDSVGAELVVYEQLGYASTHRNLYPALVKYKERFPLLLHTDKPYTALFGVLPPKPQEALEPPPSPAGQ